MSAGLRDGPVRNILNGTIFREPIICQNVPRLVPGQIQPIAVGRQGYGDICRTTEPRAPRTGAGAVAAKKEPALVVQGGST
jgi:isocitrate dehydrogenase